MQPTETSHGNSAGNIQWDPDGTAGDFDNERCDTYFYWFVNLSVLSEDNVVLKTAVVHYPLCNLIFFLSLWSLLKNKEKQSRNESFNGV